MVLIYQGPVSYSKVLFREYPKCFAWSVCSFWCTAAKLKGFPMLRKETTQMMPMRLAIRGASAKGKNHLPCSYCIHLQWGTRWCSGKLACLLRWRPGFNSRERHTCDVSPSGAADKAPGQGVFPVKGSLGWEPGGPCYLLITGVSPLFHSISIYNSFD